MKTEAYKLENILNISVKCHQNRSL